MNDVEVLEALASAASTGDVLAAGKLAEQLRPMCYGLALKSFTVPGNEVEDLVSEAYLRIIECAPKFDPMRSTAYSFFKACIQNHFKDLLVTRTRQCRYSENEYSCEELTSREAGGTPNASLFMSKAELGSSCGATEKYVGDERRASQVLGQELRERLKLLPALHRAIMELFAEGEPWSLIAQELGVDKVTVRRVIRQVRDKFAREFGEVA